MSSKYCIFVMFTAAILAVLPAAVAQAEVIGFWQFDEKSSGSMTGTPGEVIDSTGNGHDGYGAKNTTFPTYVAGYGGSVGAVNFAGTSGRVVIPHNSAFNLMLADLTDYRIEADVNAPSTAKDWRIIICKFDNLSPYSDVRGWSFRTEGNGYLSFYLDLHPVGGVILANGNTNVCDGLWHHVAVEIDANADPALTSVTLFLDGASQGTTYSSLGSNINSVNVIDVVVGQSDPVQYSGPKRWGGQIDNVKFSAFPIPEPATVSLLLSGLVGLLAYAWRKRR